MLKFIPKIRRILGYYRYLFTSLQIQNTYLINKYLCIIDYQPEKTNAMQTFNFDFEQLSFDDQKKVYVHLFSAYYGKEKLEAASSLVELRAIVDEMENEDVYPLAYMAGMLAHGVAYICSVPFDTEDGEKKNS